MCERERRREERREIERERGKKRCETKEKRKGKKRKTYIKEASKYGNFRPVKVRIQVHLSWSQLVFRIAHFKKLRTSI